MEKLKNLLLVMLAPSFTVFVAWLLSTYNEVSWWSIIFFAVLVLILQTLLLILNPKKISEPVPGFMIVGSLHAFIAAANGEDFAKLYCILAIIMFVFTFFLLTFQTLSNIMKKRSLKKGFFLLYSTNEIILRNNPD